MENEIRTKTCERCNEAKLISDFVGWKRIGPWCADCRSLDPGGAKLARDRYFSSLKTREENHERYLQRHASEQKRGIKHNLKDKQMLQTAYSMSRDAIEAYKKEVQQQLKVTHTRGQIQKILDWMDEIGRMIGD